MLDRNNFWYLRKTEKHSNSAHVEKYYRTMIEEFAATRQEFRWRYLIGLARASASEYGWAAPGQQQARALLQI